MANGVVLGQSSGLMVCHDNNSGQGTPIVWFGFANKGLGGLLVMVGMIDDVAMARYRGEDVKTEDSTQMPAVHGVFRHLGRLLVHFASRPKRRVYPLPSNSWGLRFGWKLPMAAIDNVCLPVLIVVSFLWQPLSESRLFLMATPS
jgi:hypothetical protein